MNSVNIPDLTGKNIIVTGANSGLGYQATRLFAKNNANVVMACRSLKRGGKAKSKLEDKLEDPSLDLKHLDLGNLESVRDFAGYIKEDKDKLHVLCNNAGVMAIPRQETEDGFEKQFGVNHLGHFALTAHLIEILEETEGETRVVNQSSALHEKGDIDFDDLMMEEEYNKWEAYGRSKLANVLFTHELDRKLKNSNKKVKAVCCHPGYASTNLQYKGPKQEGSKLKYGLMKLANALFGQSPAKGCLPMVYASVSDDIEGGEYIGPDGFQKMRGYPEKQEPSDLSRDKEVAERLWKISEQLTDVEFEL